MLRPGRIGRFRRNMTLCAPPAGSEGRFYGLCLLVQIADNFFGGPKPIGHVAEVDERRQISVALRDLWRGDCVSDHPNFEAELQEFPQVRLDAHVREHACENDLIHTLLTELKREIVDLRAVQFVRRANDRLPVFDILLELRKKVRAGSPEAVQRIRSLAVEYSDLVLEDLQWPLDFPSVIPV